MKKNIVLLVLIFQCMVGCNNAEERPTTEENIQPTTTAGTDTGKVKVDSFILVKVDSLTIHKMDTGKK